MYRTIFAGFLILSFSFQPLFSKGTNPNEKQDVFSDKTFTGLQFRSIGPAVASGRITDIAVDPQKRNRYFVTSASGGVWKTENDGTTWEPVFDHEGSYSIGCVTIDPQNPFVVWVGTGENNSQRSVSYGDGVYKSLDGGKNWQNMGLKDSQHISKIVVDPRNSNVVYVAAQGPLWNPGGDRGLYKTTDGGKTWKKSLTISPNTGVNDLVYDPRNPDVLIASAYQRRRRVWTLIDGGPESAIYKSTDAGASWRKIENGLPKEDMGRIGLAISPANSDIIYAIIEAANESGGFFRSTDRGENWQKMSKYVSGSPQYYQEIIADPKDPDRVYSMDTWMQVTEDGGKTFKKVGEKHKHVDNHALYVDPNDTNYLLAGCDGGVYESYDRGANWDYKANLPIMQFYRVSVDNDFPFYNVYGGTQDNASLGGPSRTTNLHGIANSDWIVTLGGDGFETQVDPEDPNIVYSQYQYGGLARFDKKSGEILYIQPQPGKDDAPLRWNWDSALLISPYSHTRLYFAAQKIFRSDDRGDSWTAISPDLTRNLNRNQLRVMGKLQRADAVAKNKSTSYFGTIISLDESTLKEGLIYAGSDDGLIQVTEDGGKTWRKIDRFSGVPSMTYVSDLLASQHDVHTVYATFDAHKDGDFKPYVLKSSDMGKTWKSISGNLPVRGTVYTIVEDHVKSNLLFVGTEFGIFFTVDGGVKWTQLKGGLPIIAVRDLTIQKRENDLVAATFGRGFYILDDYTPLRQVNQANLNKVADLFPVKKTWMYMQDAPLGLTGKSFQGDAYFLAPNPPFGAIFTYYLKDDIETLKQQRHEKEKQVEKNGSDVVYPDWNELRSEEREEKPEIVLTVKDAEGNVVRRITGPTTAGFHRVPWDLRYPPSTPVKLEPPSTDNPFADIPQGPTVVPGVYVVSLTKYQNGEETPLSETQSFTTAALGTATLAAKDVAALVVFEKKTARLQRAVLGTGKIADEAMNRIKYLKKAVAVTPAADLSYRSRLNGLENRLKDLLIKLEGDPVISKHSEPQLPSITGRVQRIVGSQWTSTSAPTQTNMDAYNIAAGEFQDLLVKMRTLIQTDLKKLEDDLESKGAPFTPSRLPDWQPE